MDSRLERLLAMHIAALNLPTPERNHKPFEGRKLELDFAWPSIKLGVEVQGGIWGKGGHSTGKGITRDCEKLCLAVVNGWRVLPVTAEQIKDGRAIEWIQKAMK